MTPALPPVNGRATITKPRKRGWGRCATGLVVVAVFVRLRRRSPPVNEPVGQLWSRGLPAYERIGFVSVGKVTVG